MNINSNELLLLSKKVKFGEEPTQAAAAMVTEPETVSNPQTGMNALMFQGMKNVANDPQLATELKLMNDIEPAQAEDNGAKEFVAPFKSNIAFQGKANKFKSVAMAAMLGLASLGAVSTLTSCDKTEVNQQVEVDLSMLIDILNELKALRNDMANQDKEMAAKYDQLISMFQQVITMMQEQAITNAQFQALVLSNQDIIIDLMVNNGMKQDEANKKLDEILKAVQSGTMSIQEALDAIKNLVSDIKGMLGQAIEDFKAYFEQMLAKQDELINTNKQGFEELIKRGDITNETLEKMANQNYELISLNEKQLDALNNIKVAIEKSNIDNNANFDKVIATLNINKNDLVAVLTKLGYTLTEINNMNAGQIIGAINENTAATEKGNMLLSKITKYLSLLPKIYQQGKITNAQLNAFYELYQQAINCGGNFSAEMLEKLEQLVNQLENIEGILGEINETLKGLSENFNKFVADYHNDKKAELGLLSGIYKNGKFQNHVLADMSRTQKNMAVNINGIKNNTDELLNIAKDDTRFNELIETIKNIKPGDIDYDKFKAMFEQLGLDLKDVINYNSNELQQVIKNFQATYIAVEQKHTEQLENINVQLGDLQIFLSNNNNNKGVIDAINNLTKSVNQGKEDVTNELKAIEDALKQIQATVDAILKSIGSQASKVDNYFQKWDVKFDAILGSLENFKSQLATIIANQKTAEAYLDNLLVEVKNLKAEIQKLQNAAGGSNFSMEELEKMWQEHDNANFERYSKLIKDLGLNQGGNVDFTTIEGLLASIDEKMDNIKDNSDILNQILNKLNGIDWSNPNYSDKLDKIIDLLKNFKCNCECGKNNEGVLGDLDDILG